MTAPAEPSPARAPRGLLIGALVFAAVVAAAGYARYGSTEGWTAAPRSQPAPQPPAAAAGGMDPAQIEAMVDRLAKRLETQPDDVEGWTMLARSYLVLGRPVEALRAFEKLQGFRPEDTQLAAAITELKAIIERMPPEQRVARAPAPPAAGATNASPHGAPASGPAAGAAVQPGVRGRVEGRIDIAPALRGKVPPGATLYVFAYALDGPRVPLAAMRTTADRLPLEFALDDSMAMNPAFKLSIAAQVVIGARISASGEPRAQPGDLQGFSAPVPAGSRGIPVVIDGVVPAQQPTSAPVPQVPPAPQTPPVLQTK